MTDPIIGAYLEALPGTVDLLADPAVAQRWQESSALEGMSVGTLACHLGGTIAALPVWLDDERRTETLDLVDYYARARWLTTGPEDAANRQIRDVASEAADQGPADLLTRVRSAVGDLRTRLPDLDPDRPVYVTMRQVTLTARDAVTTRIMELAVHADDLAVSVGLPTVPVV